MYIVLTNSATMPDSQVLHLHGKKKKNRNYWPSNVRPFSEFFQAGVFFLSVRVPNGGRILQLRTDKRVIGGFSHFLAF